ncbi:MAG TPA: ABC transporter ATP-binding protein [Thermodesulfobacteriota bacterium]|jgi:branched-chain amino acid transport system ATP-binding protein
MKDILAIKNLTVRFDGLQALSGLDMQVQTGSIMGLIGPNGAGKTTVFNTISGFIRPSEGSISFYEKEIANIKPYKIVSLGLARTFQNIRLFGDLSVIENVMIGFHLSYSSMLLGHLLSFIGYKRVENQLYERALLLLDRTGLLNFVHEKASSLPYGLQRKLEIARAIATRPKLLLLDEPAAGMNPSEKEELMKFIRKVRDKLALTIILIEHDMHVVMEICDRITVLEYGEKIAEGNPQDIKNNQRVIEAYLGEAGVTEG